VQRVLAVEPSQERDRRLVQDVAVKDVLDEAVDEAERDERRDAVPDGSQDLRLPDVGHDEPERPSRTASEPPTVTMKSQSEKG